MEDANSSKTSCLGRNQRDDIDVIDKMQDARWKRADEMEQKDEMKKWGYR